MIHIILPMNLVELSSFQPKIIFFPPRLSFELESRQRVERGKRELEWLAENLKTNSTLTTLEFYWNSIGDNGAEALSKVLKTNSTLTTLNLRKNIVGDKGFVALSEVPRSRLTIRLSRR
ncbi:MAG: hypothetical protein J3R72DRAFT_450451 [Linnemannia gamsii]|nr:MAG: hypothetical protein J3R72DRAFT_450451 [Linnemannia gamsii]